MNKHEKDVVFLCQYFYPEYISSATLPFDTAKGLAESGLKVGALVGYPYEYSKTKNIKTKETVENVFIERLKYINLDKKSTIKRLINYVSFVMVNLINIFKLRQYKIIVVYSNPPILVLIAYLASKMFNSKIVFVSYDVYPEIAVKTNKIKENGIIYKIMMQLNNLIFKKASKVVALSNDMKEFLADNRDIDSDDIVVIPNWESKSVKRTENKESVSGENDEFIVSYFGNMGTCQDMDTLLGAAYELRHNSNIKFMFVGHGNKKEYVREYIENHKLDNCSLKGFLMGSEYKEAMDKSDIFVVSLSKGVEGLAVPSKTYSYLKAGKPVIAIMNPYTDIAIDLESYNSGFSVEQNNFKYLARLILYLFENPSTTKKWEKTPKVCFQTSTH